MKKKANKYSYNCGLPMDRTIKSVTISEGLRLLNDIRTSGKIFRVDFIKRSDESIRTMVCRVGNKSALVGGKKGYKADDHGLLTVWEFGKGFRSIPIDNILAIKHRGSVYALSGLKPGEYKVSDNVTGRTIPAQTSPMFSKE